MREEKDKITGRNRSFITDTLLIALLTGAGYLAAFFYQYSYLDYFGIPVFFVDIDLTSILMTTSIGIVMVIVFGVIIISIAQIKPKNKILEFISIFLVTTLFAAIPATLAFMVLYPLFGYMAILPVLIFLFVFLTILLLKRYNPQQKIITQKENFLSKLKQLYGTFPILFSFLLFIFIYSCYVFGPYKAKTDIEYLVSNTEPAIVLISNYDNNFIGVTYNSSTRMVGNLTLISQDKISSGDIYFESKEIGPLESQYGKRRVRNLWRMFIQ